MIVAAVMIVAAIVIVAAMVVAVMLGLGLLPLLLGSLLGLLALLLGSLLLSLAHGFALVSHLVHLLDVRGLVGLDFGGLDFGGLVGLDLGGLIGLDLGGLIGLNLGGLVDIFGQLGLVHLVSRDESDGLRAVESPGVAYEARRRSRTGTWRLGAGSCAASETRQRKSGGDRHRQRPLEM